MKTLLITLITLFTINAQALEISPEDMTVEQQTQLINVLNQMKPEVLDAFLTDEALEWYISKFNRNEMTVEESNTDEVTTDRVDGIGGFNDPSAPQFL